jgi:site-specific recombinase XerD
MEITNCLINYRRFLKRKNCSPHTVKNYMSMLKHFHSWLPVQVEQATPAHVGEYIDFLLSRHLHPKTINCHLWSIRAFYNYLRNYEGLDIPNPVKKGVALRLPRPLPHCLQDHEVSRFFETVRSVRDKAIFMLMLRSGMRVQEVANLSFACLDLRRKRITVQNGKGGKDRVVSISQDALEALGTYLSLRPVSKSRKVFLVEKGNCKGQPISTRGIQKRMEYYARKSGVKVSCHCLRHTMATQLLNAEAELATIQDLLGHSWVTTTQRYCSISNLKVERDYHKAMAVLVQKTSEQGSGYRH